MQEHQTKPKPARTRDHAHEYGRQRRKERRVHCRLGRLHRVLRPAVTDAAKVRVQERERDRREDVHRRRGREDADPANTEVPRPPLAAHELQQKQAERCEREEHDRVRRPKDEIGSQVVKLHAGDVEQPPRCAKRDPQRRERVEDDGVVEDSVPLPHECSDLDDQVDEEHRVRNQQRHGRAVHHLTSWAAHARAPPAA